MRRVLSVVGYIAILSGIIRLTPWVVEHLPFSVARSLNLPLTLPPAYLVTLLWWLPLPNTGIKKAKLVLTTFFLRPIMMLNVLTGALAGLWLLTLGQWFTLVIIVGFFVAASIFFSIWSSIELRIMLLATGNVMAPRRASSIAWFAGRYTFIVGGLGLCIAFTYLPFVSRSPDSALTPILLLTYSTSVAILRRWAWAGQELTVNNINILFVHQLGCILLAGYCYQNAGSLSYRLMALSYLAPAAIGYIVYLASNLIAAKPIFEADSGNAHPIGAN